MKFDQMEYRRIEIGGYTADFERILAAFTGADSAAAQLDAVHAFFKLHDRFSTMYNLTYIRHTVNTQDKFYSAENDYYDENMPRFEALENRFRKALLASRFRPELEKELGALLFRNAQIDTRAFDPKIMDDMAEENRLCSRYQKLVASAQIPFDGKTLNVSQLGYYMTSPDRDVRRRAYAARTGFFLPHGEELDEIYDKLVKCRTRQAQKLGYRNFVELGYLRRRRNCYTAEDVAKFRQMVKTHIVPVTRRLAEEQRERLGLEKLAFYDEGTLFPQGNPRPQGTPEEIFENGRKMYRELSPQTGEFFDFMLENNLFDVLGRPGKAAGGYCTEIADYKSPFIFANFNGTTDDINTLTHEAGHAFQYYRSRDIYPTEYVFPTLDACEIHSMSMEFFTWPWMELFFGGEADRYRYMHLSGALTFLPYGCAVDEFQHIVYENPDMTPAQRKEAWQGLEADYLPRVDYEGDRFFGAGCRWQRQLHIYEAPFYYIDYCVAQTCALEFWAMAAQDKPDAWQRYVRLCSLGGKDTLTGLIGRVGLQSPFTPGCLQTVADAAGRWLRDFDPARLG